MERKTRTSPASRDTDSDTDSDTADEAKAVAVTAPGPIRRAILPCGGRGTRMLPLTGGAPKELLPLAGVPILQHVLAECARSGISSVLIVVSPEKSAIVDFAGPLAGNAGMPHTIQFTAQPEPRGLADAIRCGRDFAANEPFVVALPDNLFLGAEPAVAEVTAAFSQAAMNVVGMTEVLEADASRRGPTPIYPGIRRDDLFGIERIPDKGAHAATFDTRGAASAFTGVGRYVFTDEVFALIDDVARTLPADTELDDIPVMQALLAQGRLVGRVLHGRFLDVGLPQGYREAADLVRH